MEQCLAIERMLERFKNFGTQLTFLLLLANLRCFAFLSIGVTSNVLHPSPSISYLYHVVLSFPNIRYGRGPEDDLRGQGPFLTITLTP
jgi:hypothetical protein